MPEEPNRVPSELPAETKLYVNEAIDSVKEAVSEAKDEFRKEVDKLREANKSHSSKLAGGLAAFGLIIGILAFFGFNQTVSKAIDQRLQELGVAALQKRANAASAQAESYSATASTYVAQLKGNADDAQRLLNQLRRDTSTEELKKVSVGVPLGTILPFAGENIPSGWLVCDGKELPKSEFPELFSVIGISWGGSGAVFKVPDLSGRFLRGAAATGSPDKFKGGKVGSYQGAMLPPHTHGKGSLQVAGGRNGDTAEMVFQTGSPRPIAGMNFGIYPKGPRPIDSNVTAVYPIELLGETSSTNTVSQNVLDTELHPANAAVSYMIKVK